MELIKPDEIFGFIPYMEFGRDPKELNNREYLEYLEILRVVFGIE
jgi:hypothetical protein